MKKPEIFWILSIQSLRNCSFASHSNLLISISLQPGYVNHRYFNICSFKQTDFIGLTYIEIIHSEFVTKFNFSNNHKSI